MLVPSSTAVFTLSPASKMADRIVPLGEKRLMDVKLGELGSWLGKRDFTPNGVLASIRNGHDRYYNKYINVKKGGIGGVAMLLVGYVALSYLWEYDHLKHDRWRKYH
ncbi:ATP synthase subunit f, mitochondrial-like [Oncorhynchus keta]|uniref:ATP synthase subunit f, mitochondrial-like n=2 Tax=Oncorhynchus TaxID=8016 RepID=UPI00227AED8A|nr:ATP synthase subunit f, mitochondrial-like [Oncorhynchus keta]XP_052367504.1 ATP synthase subunit f, mitochondrial-like [Oncorhynchus keta]